MLDTDTAMLLLHSNLTGYKFLQKPLEESTIPSILQYVNRFEDEQREKLATGTALMIQAGLASAAVLNTLQKDHLTKDGECSIKRARL